MFTSAPVPVLTTNSGPPVAEARNIQPATSHLRGGGWVFVIADFSTSTVLAAGVLAALTHASTDTEPVSSGRVDGSENGPASIPAFKMAGSRAFVTAANKAGPTLLEPVMSLEVVTPEESVGDVLGDLHARRGKVAGITVRHGVQAVACFVPMATMFGYATDLRSRTRGRATYSMELDHYAEVPQQLRDELTSRARA